MDKGLINFPRGAMTQMALRNVQSGGGHGPTVDTPLDITKI